MYTPVSSLEPLSWVTLLSFPGWWTTCYHLRSVDLPNDDLLVLQCFSRWSVLCRLSWCSMHQTVDSYYHFSDVFSLAGGCNEIDCSLYFSRYPCSGSVQVAIWYCFVIKHRRRRLEVARGWFKLICRILAQLWDDSDLLWRCLINLN